MQGGNVNQHVCIIRPNKKELDSEFLKYSLQSSIGQRQIDSFQAGGNREGLNFGQIKSFTLRSNPHFWGGSIPWVTVKDFATFNPYHTQEFTTLEGIKNSASNLIPKGTLITSTRMGLGEAVIYEVDVTINQDLKAIFPKKDIDNSFLYHWFKMNAEHIQSLGNGSTVKGISLPDLKKIAFAKTTLFEQRAIAAVLSDMDAEILSIEQQLDKARNLKQGNDAGAAYRKDSTNMKNVGHNEEITQKRVIKLFCNELGYRYLGNWIDRPDNRNIEEDLILKYLQKQGYEDCLIRRAIHSRQSSG